MMQEAALETETTVDNGGGGERPPSAMDLLSQLAMMGDAGGNDYSSGVHPRYLFDHADCSSALATAGDTAKSNGIDAYDSDEESAEQTPEVRRQYDPGLQVRRVSAMKERMQAMDAMVDAMDTQASRIDDSYLLLERLQQRGGRRGFKKESEGRRVREGAHNRARREAESGEDGSGVGGGDGSDGEDESARAVSARTARHKLLERHLDNLDGEMQSSKYLLAQLEKQLGTEQLGTSGDQVQAHPVGSPRRGFARKSGPRSPAAAARNTAVSSDLASARQLLDALRAETGR
jgi:hypothetical protein